MAARSASAGMPVCDYMNKQVSGLPGRTYSQSPWFVFALQTGDQWSGAEYMKGMERLSLPGPKKWGLGQAEVTEPLWRWCSPHLLSAPSSNAAHVGQQVWAALGKQRAVQLGASFSCHPSRQLCSGFSLSLLISQQSSECDRVQASPALVCARTASRLCSDHSTALVPANPSLCLSCPVLCQGLWGVPPHCPASPSASAPSASATGPQRMKKVEQGKMSSL